MKTFILFLFVCLVGLAGQIQAQGGNAASLDADRARLEKKMDEMRKAAGTDAYDPEGIANRASSELKMFKGRHPEENVAAYEQEIKEFRASLSEAESDEAEEEANAEGFEEAYEKAMEGAYGPVSLRPLDASEGEIAKSQQQLQAITAKVDAFTRSEQGRSASEMDPESISGVMETISNAYTELKAELSGIKGQLTTGFDRRYTTEAYLHMLALERFWSANGVLFPDNAEVKDAAARVTALHREVGSLESVEAARAKNETARLAAVRMEPATVHDEAIEAEMKRVYLASRWGAGANVIKVNLTSKTWQTVYHKVTGKIAGRYIANCTIVFKDGAGNCWTDHAGLMQDYNGSSYNASRPYYTFDQKAKILCENVR